MKYKPLDILLTIIIVLFLLVAIYEIIRISNDINEKELKLIESEVIENDYNSN
jgi:hypothetical protein